MIDWISNWLQNIIIIVLLATFVDLLLPNTNIQKYAKFVLGLLIILTIITPIFSIFSEDFSISRLIQEIELQVYSKEAFFNTDSLNTDQYNNQQDYQKKIINRVEEKMKEHIQGLLESRFNVNVKELILNAEVIDEVWTIQQLYIHIDNSSLHEENLNEKGQIKEVESVKVNIELNKQKTSTKENQVTDDAKKVIGEIKKLLENELGLSKENIIVDFQFGTE